MKRVEVALEKRRETGKREGEQVSPGPKAREGKERAGRSCPLERLPRLVRGICTFSEDMSRLELSPVLRMRRGQNGS